MRVITESEMNFGGFDEEDLFYIEKSKIYKDLGSGIKTVEFILKQNERCIIFLEAKKSCPNATNRYDSEEKEQKFEEYYASITEKFIASLQIYLAVVLNRFQNTEEIGSKLKNVNNMRGMQLKFILVIKNAKDGTWLTGPMAELKARLRQIRKIWGIEIAVLNEELAREYNMICQ